MDFQGKKRGNDKNDGIEDSNLVIFIIRSLIHNCCDVSLCGVAYVLIDEHHQTDAVK